MQRKWTYNKKILIPPHENSLIYLVNTFSKVAGYKNKHAKLVAFLYTKIYSEKSEINHVKYIFKKNNNRGCSTQESGLCIPSGEHTRVDPVVQVQASELWGPESNRADPAPSLICGPESNRASAMEKHGRGKDALTPSFLLPVASKRAGHGVTQDSERTSPTLHQMQHTQESGPFTLAREHTKVTLFSREQVNKNRRVDSPPPSIPPLPQPLQQLIERALNLAWAKQ